MRTLMAFCGLVVIVVAGAGCGFFGAHIDGFTGTWSWDGGSALDINCPGESFTETQSGNVSLIEGADADVVFSNDDCSWNYDVDGDTASIIPGQSCEYDRYTQQGDRVENTIEWSSYTLNRSGESMTVSANGTLTLEDQHGNRVDCSLSLNGSMTKVGG